jgi:hypothetical protein
MDDSGLADPSLLAKVKKVVKQGSDLPGGKGVQVEGVTRREVERLRNGCFVSGSCQIVGSRLRRASLQEKASIIYGDRSAAGRTLAGRAPLASHLDAAGGAGATQDSKAFQRIVQEKPDTSQEEEKA